MANPLHAQLEFPRLQGNAEKLRRDLGRILHPDRVSSQTPDRLSYGRDCNAKAVLWVRRGEVKYPPDVVAWPDNKSEVARVLAYANDRAIPVIPFGGGSGVCGGTWAVRGGIALDLKRMNQILKLDRELMKVRAQTGINGEILERALNAKGLTLGHFPSSIYVATLGGYLACRSAGQYSSLYGKIEDMVEGLEVILADGELVQIGGVKESPHLMDLKELFLGSEGTLGVITEATLRIHPQPKAESFLGFRFPNLEKAVHAAREIMQQDLKPCLIRLYDPLDSFIAASFPEEKASITEFLKKILNPVLKLARGLSLKLVLKNPHLLNQMVDLLPSQVLFLLGFQGESALVPGELRAAQDICQSLGGKSLGEKPGKYWLKHRYSISYKLSPLFDQGFFADTMEVATTWRNLLPLYHAIRKVIERHALVFAHFSHAYHEGCSIYFTFVGFSEQEEECETLYDRIWDEALRACIQHKGTISHHHGVGFLKGAYMKEEWGDAFHWLKKVKDKLDPKGILNPGKLGFS